MRITINASKIDITPSLKKYAETKISSLSRFVKHFEKTGEIIVFLEISRSTKHHKKGEVFYAEATLQFPGKNIRVNYTDSDVRAAIDKVKDLLIQKVLKFKESKTKSKRSPNRHREEEK